MISIIIGINLKCILFEIAFLLLCFSSIYLNGIYKFVLFLVAYVSIILKVIVNIKCSIPYILLSIVQILFVSTYLILCYRIQFKKLNVKLLIKNIKRYFLIMILGEYAFNIINSEDNLEKTIKK